MKTKQTTTKLITMLFSVLVLSACNLVDLESPAPALDIASPLGTPDSEAAFMTALTNDDMRKWDALTFELEGLDGFQNCRLDDSFTFFNDGTYRYDGGDVLCGGADDQRIKTGIWEIDFSELTIVFDRGTSLETIASVSGLQENRMELIGQVEVFGQMLDIRGIYEYAL